MQGGDLFAMQGYEARPSVDAAKAWKSVRVRQRWTNDWLRSKIPDQL